MKTLICALSVGSMLLFVSPVPAAGPQPPPPADATNAVDIARVSFQQGVQLFHEGSFEAALAEFRKAYQISPSYRVLYNIAQAYYEIHDYVGAQKTLKQYMTEGGSEIVASRRGQVDEINQKLDERIAYVEVITNLDGADVRVDDISVGVSPLLSPVPVNAGPRRISAVKAGHAVASQLVTVAGRDRVNVTLSIPEAVLARPREQPITVTRPVPLVTRPDTPARGSATGLVVSLAATAGCAVATGVFAWLAFDAKTDFDHQLGTIPRTKDEIDSQRSRMKTYAAIADGFGAATLVAAGVSLYFALSGHAESGPRRAARARRSVVLTPTPGGMALRGEW